MKEEKKPAYMWAAHGHLERCAENMRVAPESTVMVRVGMLPLPSGPVVDTPPTVAEVEAAATTVPCWTVMSPDSVPLLADKVSVPAPVLIQLPAPLMAPAAVTLFAPKSNVAVTPLPRPAKRAKTSCVLPLSHWSVPDPPKVTAPALPKPPLPKASAPLLIVTAPKLLAAPLFSVSEPPFNVTPKLIVNAPLFVKLTEPVPHLLRLLEASDPGPPTS